ncbi:UDP-2,3-diacylglucosamine diphosphatase LpxI [Candidatus Sumerlaeota bacterium]|nr:UDP-2,3-diacylglucosamine diphosphatase LpxI [Candidatus Sumerlaeota bacterium]
MTERVGIICGRGHFPLNCAEAARNEGRFEVIGLAIKGYASKEIERVVDVDKVFWFGVGQVGKLIKTCKKLAVNKITFAGKIDHVKLTCATDFLDVRGIKILNRLPDRRAETVIGAVIQEFANEGIETLDPTIFLPDALARQGVLTPKRPPTPAEMRDIEFGFPLAKSIAGKDIGQTIVVQKRIVVAVEGIEGTDHCIERAGEYAGEGNVVVKVSRPKQDFRMDLPVIGPDTIKTMAKAKARCLAVCAGQTLFIHQAESIKLAEKNNIAIYGIDNNTPFE